MTPPSSLALRASPDSPAPSWILDGLVALPVAVTTAAWAIPVDAELRLWINRPEAGRTEQLRVLDTHRVEQLPALPIVVAGVARCEGGLIVTAADTAGQPRVGGVTADGRIAWQHAVPGPPPSRWPVPDCAPEPVITWQTSPADVELARVNAGGISLRRTVPVGGPPLAVAAADGAIWAAWADAAGIHGREITPHRVRDIRVVTPRPSTLAVGAWAGRACLAWTLNGAGFLAHVVPGSAAPEAPVALELAGAADGTLAVVSGPEPIVWAQCAEPIDGESPRWRSVMSVPGSRPIEVDGLVHAVAWWGEAVAVVGAGELLVLRRAPASHRTRA